MVVLDYIIIGECLALSLAIFTIFRKGRFCLHFWHRWDKTYLDYDYDYLFQVVKDLNLSIECGKCGKTNYLDKGTNAYRKLKASIEEEYLLSDDHLCRRANTLLEYMYEVDIVTGEPIPTIKVKYHITPSSGRRLSI